VARCSTGHGTSRFGSDPGFPRESARSTGGDRSPSLDGGFMARSSTAARSGSCPPTQRRGGRQTLDVRRGQACLRLSMMVGHVFDGGAHLARPCGGATAATLLEGNT
jgi:hypothetical protein